MSIKIEKNNEKIYVKSPYNKAFIEKAKQLQGKWDSETSSWVFVDRSDIEELLRKLLIEIYGEDDTFVKRVLVEIDVRSYAPDDAKIKVGHIVLATRRFRDEDVKLENGAYIFCGGFEDRGGSNKYPLLCPLEGTKIRVELPETLYEKIKNKQGVSLVELEKTEETISKEIEAIDKEIERLNKLKCDLIKKLNEKDK